VVHTKTGGGHEKVDTYKDLDEALGKLQTLRATMIEYIKTTPDDMRAHSFGDYGNVIDCWQWMLEISTHAERHIQQIRDIKTTRSSRRNNRDLRLATHHGFPLTRANLPEVSE
jgi:hypothetical protein